MLGGGGTLRAFVRALSGRRAAGGERERTEGGASGRGPAWRQDPRRRGV